MLGRPITLPPMRILHVTVSLDPHRGGPPTVVTRLAPAQALLGHDVHILCHHDPDAAERADRMLAGIPGIDRVRIHQVPRERGPVGRFNAANARAALRTLLPSLDILHLHEIWARIVPAGAAAAREARLPYLVAVHNNLSPPYIHQKGLKKKIGLALGYRAVLERAAAIHVLTSAEAHAVEGMRLGVPLEIIPNGIFREEIEPLPPRGAFRAAHSEIGDDPYILFLSRLHRNKGLDRLADAFAQVVATRPETRLVVAGPDEGARDDFIARVGRLGIQARVHLVGPLYGKDKLAAYADAAVFCLPSRAEGFSMSIIEALATSLPVVISETCNFPEVAGASAGIVVPLETGAITRALLRVLADPAERVAMGARGRELALSRYTWPAIAARSIDAYSRYVRRP